MIETLNNAKETLKNLIEFLMKKTNKNQSQLSVGAGYEIDTLSQLKSKPEGHEAVIKKLKLIYKDELKNSMFDDSMTNALEDPREPYILNRRRNKNGNKKNLTPVFNTRASAGHAILFNDRPELIAEYVDIPFIGKSDGVIEIVGQSMSPTYVNGTRIAVRKLEDKQLIYPNECYYIIDVNYDGRVKRLIKSEKEDHIVLRSDNKEYPDVELPWSKIISVCKILCRIIKS